MPARRVTVPFSLLTTIGMPPGRALHHSIRLSERIPADPSPTQSANWLWSYPPFSPADSYRYIHRLKPYTIRFLSASGFQSAICRPNPTAGCGATLLHDPSCPGIFHPDLELQKATDMPPPRALYHSIPLSERIPADPSPTQSANWLWSYSPFSPANSYRDTTATSLTPFYLSQKADSCGPIPD